MRRLTSAAADLLREILTRDITTANDVVSLILTGETLRRVASHTPEARAETSTLLGEYDRALIRHASLVPSELDSDLETALAALGHASENASIKPPDDLLRAVDEVLMVAAAAHRMGRLERSALDALAKRALDVSRELAVDAEAVWAEANDRAGRIGPDPDFPHLTNWLEPLASFAPSRVAASVAVRRGTLDERRARAIDAVMALRATTKQQQQEESNVILLDFYRPRPTTAAAAASDFEPAWDDASGREVYRQEGLSVRVREMDARDGSEAAIRVVAEEAANVDLKAADAVVVTVGGKHVNGTRIEAKRLYWLGWFDVDGDVEVRVGSHSISFTVRRPGRS